MRCLAIVDDWVTLALLMSVAFFVALSFGLLFRYRQVSQKISASSDLGHDLWQALEQRMKKQDERILDMMGRLEVIQARVTGAVAMQAPVSTGPPPSTTAPSSRTEARQVDVTERKPAVQRVKSQAESRTSRPSPGSHQLDETQLAAIRLLDQTPKNTRQLTDALQKSREHTARMMKELFDVGLVTRDDSTKPFVYRLTNEGKSRLSG